MTSLNITAHLPFRVDPNLVRALFLVIIFLILMMVRTLENNYFLVRTKLGYLRYLIDLAICHPVSKFAASHL